MRIRIGVGLVVAAASAIAVTQVGAQDGGGVSTGGFVDRAPAGTLVLETFDDTSVRVAWYDVDGTTLVTDPSDGSPYEVQVQLRKRDKCELDATLLSELLVLVPLAEGSPVGFDIGLVSNGLGSRSSNNCGTANGRLGQGEAFEVSLGSAFGDDILIDAATFDIEGKFSATVDWSTFDGDLPVAVAEDVVLSNLSDNGADSGPNDNNPVTIGAEGPGDDYTSVRLGPGDLDPRGEIALEGGGDYADPASNRTELTLVRAEDFEYAFDCGDVESEAFDEGLTLADLDGAQPQQATIVRYDDVDANGQPTNGCQPIGADLSAEDLGVLLRKTTDDAQGVEQDPQVRIELFWIVRQDVTDVDDALRRQIDLDGDGADFDFEPATYCTSYTPDPPDADGIDGFIDVDHPGTVVHPPDARFAGGFLPWCLILDERHPTVLTVEGVDVPVIIQRQVWDGRGDPRWI